MQFRLKYENIVILLILDSTFVAHLQNCISISSHLIILTLIAFEQQPELTFIRFTTLNESIYEPCSTLRTKFSDC